MLHNRLVIHTVAFILIRPRADIAEKYCASSFSDQHKGTIGNRLKPKKFHILLDNSHIGYHHSCQQQFLCHTLDVYWGSQT